MHILDCAESNIHASIGAALSAGFLLHALDAPHLCGFTNPSLIDPTVGLLLAVCDKSVRALRGNELSGFLEAQWPRLVTNLTTDDVAQGGARGHGVDRRAQAISASRYRAHSIVYARALHSKGVRARGERAARGDYRVEVASVTELAQKSSGSQQPVPPDHWP